MAEAAIPAPASVLSRFYRPPFIGLIAFTAVFLGTPLAHAFSAMMREQVSADAYGWAYIAIGTVAFVMLLIGIKRDDEISGTLLGFASGLLMWIGWSSYALRFNEISLGLPPVDLGGGMEQHAHQLFIQGSIGVCITTMLFFMFSKDTKCNAFRWIQRTVRFNPGEAGTGQGRSYDRITFLETVYVIWFCYAFSLFLVDPRHLGREHPLTYVIVGAMAVWGFYLLWRLMKFTRIMAGIRYAIPVKSILWIPVGEFFPRWGFYDEVWLKPSEYSISMWTGFALCVALLVITAFLPQRRQA